MRLGNGNESDKLCTHNPLGDANSRRTHRCRRREGKNPRRRRKHRRLNAHRDPRISPQASPHLRMSIPDECTFRGLLERHPLTRAVRRYANAATNWAAAPLNPADMSPADVPADSTCVICIDSLCDERAETEGGGVVRWPLCVPERARVDLLATGVLAALAERG